ncbi:MAG: TatD family hydrolase [Thermoleophilia bacterium]|nr:TatD family hydrolase [Thermoleophilia bacterium]
MIDLHCHVDLFPDPGAIVVEATRRGCHVLAVTTTPLAWEGTNAVVGRAPRVCVALGLHPELVAQRHTEVRQFRELLPIARFVGEIGMDGSAPHRDTLRLQRAVFDDLLRATADAGGRVMSIHSRGAVTPVLDSLEARPDAGTAVLHWFTGSVEELRRAARLGCWFSVGPEMLGTKGGRTLLRIMARDRVLTESDGPFSQAAGTPITPWQLGGALAILGEVWDLDEEEVQRKLDANLRVLTNESRRHSEAFRGLGKLIEEEASS